jgi:hypothetical protein
VGARHALFPWTCVWRSRFRGPHAPRRHSSRHAKISISWRDRFARRSGQSLLSEAFSPGSTAPCRERYAKRGADTPASAFRVGTVAMGTAPAFDRPLAPRYGSDLLTLRLRSLCSWVTCFQAAQSRRFTRLCLARSLPAARFFLRARFQ